MGGNVYAVVLELDLLPIRPLRSPPPPPLSGLSKRQSERMVEEFHVYMLDTGRINMAGLNEESIPILADAIHAVVTTSSS